MTNTVTLTGYLGKDPQRRETRSRTYIKTANFCERFGFQHRGRTIYDADDVLEHRAEYDLTTTPRSFAVLSLATHQQEGRRRVTTWHRIVAWNTDHQHLGLHLVRKGDQIRITGRKTSFTAVDGTTINQIELTDFQVLKRKVRDFSNWTLVPRSRQPRRPASQRYFVGHDGRRVPLTGAPILNAATP